MLKVTPVRIKLAESSQLLNAYLYFKPGFLKLELIGDRVDFYDTAGPQIEFSPADLAAAPAPLFGPVKLLFKKPLGKGANQVEYIYFGGLTGRLSWSKVEAYIHGRDFRPVTWPWALAGMAAVTLPWLIYVFAPLGLIRAIIFSVVSFSCVAALGWFVLKALWGRWPAPLSSQITFFVLLHVLGGVLIYFSSLPLFFLYCLSLAAWLIAIWIGAGLIKALLGFVAYMFLGAVVMFRLSLAGFEMNYALVLALTYGIDILKTEQVQRAGQVTNGKYIHDQGFEFPIPKNWSIGSVENSISDSEFQPGIPVTRLKPIDDNGDQIAVYLLPKKLNNVKTLQQQYIKIVNFWVRSGRITEPNLIKFAYESFPVRGGIVYPTAFDYSQPLDDTDRRMTIYYVALKKGSLVFVCDEQIRWSGQGKPKELTGFKLLKKLRIRRETSLPKNSDGDGDAPPSAGA